MDSDTSEPEACSAINDFWKGISDSRFDRICEAPAPKQYTSAIISSVQALDEEREVLWGALRVIQRRCCNEEYALNEILKTLHKCQAMAECTIGRSIATINYHRNALIPMARLPPEILAQILVLHAQPVPRDRNPNTAAIVTRVCKRWREVALGCPELWSYIDCNSCRSVAWMEKMIDLSRAVPLSIELGVPSATKVALVVKNLHRCRSLSLDPFMSHDPYPFFEDSNQLAPLLWRLRIDGSQPDGRFAFPPDFLRGRTPNLRHIRLTTRSYVPWCSALFENLVTLEVDSGVGRDVPDVSSVEMLLRALARMPTLEVLSLHNCFPPPTPSTIISTHVHLPNLEQLRVTSPLQDSTRFLRQLTANASVVVHLDTESSDMSVADVEEFFTIFPSYLYTTPPVTQMLQFTWRNGRRKGDRSKLTINARTAQPGTAITNSFHLSFGWRRGVIQWQNISPLDLTRTCFAALVSPRLWSFRILRGDIKGWDVEVWRELGRMAPGLRRLSPGRGALSVELCKALRPPDGSDLAPEDCCLPALSYLELAIPCGFRIPTPDEGKPSLTMFLAPSLAARAAIGCATPELVFLVPGEHSPEGWSEPFKRAVPGITVREDYGQGDPVMVSPMKEFRPCCS